VQVKYIFHLKSVAVSLMLGLSNNALALVDLSSKIQVLEESIVYNSVASEYEINGTIRNVTEQAISAPITLIVNSLTPEGSSIVLSQADGATPEGKDFKVVLPTGELAANASSSFKLRFGLANPVSALVGDAIDKVAKSAFKNISSPSLKITYKVTQIPAGNHQPVANAGLEQFGLVGDTIPLDGSASSDADGNPLAFEWSLTELPTNSTAKITGASNATSSLLADTPGVYIASLVVNDSYVLSKPNTVKITVYPDSSKNHIPKITSGAIVSGTATRQYNYNVIAVDPDGDKLTFKLTQFPSGMTISPTGSIQWAVPNREHEHMGVTIEVSDGRGGVTEQKFSIHIMPCECA